MNTPGNLPKLFSLIAVFALCLILFGTQTTLAQKTQTEIFVETLAQAEAKMQAKQWAEAAAVWEQVVKANPVQGRFWEQLGLAYYNAKDYRKSIPAYEKQLELGFGQPANAAYNIACDYALAGDKEQAIKWLEKALEMKFSSLQQAQTDTDLESIRSDPRYRNMVGLIDTSKMSRDEGWRTDLRFLAREIKRRGWNLFPRIGTEVKFDAEVKRINDAIPNLTDAQIQIEMMKLMRRVGDGHSSLLGSRDRKEWLESVPVLFYMFEEGLFIIAADPKHKDLLGSQVLKFGRRPVDEIVTVIHAATSEDNKIWIKQFAPYRMRNLAFLHAAGAIPDANKVELNLRGMDGKERTVTLTTDMTQPNIWNTKPNPPEWVNLPQTLGTPVPLYLKNAGANYWFEYLPDNKTVYFGFNSVRNDEKESLAAFSERLFKFVNENAVEKLVIDMRWNNGGNTFLLTPLVQGLIKNEKINRRGKLFVIIGRRTFSAAQNASTFFERYTNATFVGEPTGASPNFVGEEDPFVLPYSKIMANVSHLYWQSAFPQDERIWIAPQIYLPPTFEAYRTNRDAALEAILNYKEKTN
ncbi:MAG: tetratricopeptide repeat protein [Acidobacteria bacterium]|nr:tetratricopeptide repeat protein [Acidobacteriota bacterium]